MARRKFSGTVAVAKIMIAGADSRLDELKIGATASGDRRMRMRRKFSICSISTTCRMLTVVDENRRPMGAITVDDVVTRLRAKL